MTEYVPATELDVFERVQRLTAYLKAMVEYADEQTFPGDDYLTEIDRFITQLDELTSATSALPQPSTPMPRSASPARPPKS